MKHFLQARSKFPWPEYQPVFEAAELYLHGRGPLVEHGTLMGRWGILPDSEKSLRSELSTFFESCVDFGSDEMEEEAMTECLSIIDKYLDKESAKAGVKPAPVSLKESSLVEKLVFLNSVGRLSPGQAGRWGISPLDQQRAIVRGALVERNGTYWGSRNSRKQRLFEEDLEPGQSVYRVQDGEVQQVQVVGSDSGKVTVAGNKAGSEVEEEDPKELASEDPEGLVESDGKVRDYDLGDGFVAAIGESSDGEFVTVISDERTNTTHSIPAYSSLVKAKRHAGEWVEKAKRNKLLESAGESANPDPSRQEMLDFFREQGQSGDDVEVAIYYFTQTHHSGKASNLYKAGCDSPFKPGPMASLVTEDEEVQEMYDWLVLEYAPGEADDWSSDALGDPPNRDDFPTPLEESVDDNDYHVELETRDHDDDIVSNDVREAIARAGYQVGDFKLVNECLGTVTIEGPRLPATGERFSYGETEFVLAHI